MNMGYVRFENTYKDLLDCAENMDLAQTESEKKYRIKVIKLCKFISNDYYDLVEEKKQAISYFISGFNI